MAEKKLMEHSFTISLGGEGGQNRGTVRSKEISVAGLFDLLKEPMVDQAISAEEFQTLPKSERDTRKAQPGFLVAGRFKDNRRRLTHQLGRSCVQIDADNVKPEHFQRIRDGQAGICKFAFILHTTRSHSQEKPRFRLLIFLDREVNADEANALTRLLTLGLAEDPKAAIELIDPASFRYNQIMYRPSVSRGQEYICELNEAPVLEVDAFLEDYPEWKDLRTLPRQKKEREKRVSSQLGKMENPREKSGYIGAWSRAWPISEAISEFLPDIYEAVSDSSELRYSYVPGSSTNGVVVLENDTILYSHHASDPVQGAANCFDLVRIHKFGHLDDGVHGNSQASDRRSQEAMNAFAAEDEATRAELFRHIENRRSGQLDDLGADDDLDDDRGPAKAASSSKVSEVTGWQETLELTQSGNIKRSLHNAMTIVTCDPDIATFIGKDEMTGAPAALGRFNFPKLNFTQPPFYGRPRRWTDTDDAALAWVLAAPEDQGGYALTFQKQELQYALLQRAEQNSFNPVLDRIREVTWDGVERVETALIDWLGAEDNAYHRELARVWFAAAIARLYEPGHEFHLVEPRRVCRRQVDVSYAAMV